MLQIALSAAFLVAPQLASADEISPLVGTWTGWAQHAGGDASLDNFVVLRIDDGKGAVSTADYIYPDYHITCLSELDFASMLSKTEWSLDDTTLMSPSCVDGEVRLLGDPSTDQMDFEWLYTYGVLDAAGVLSRISDDPRAPAHVPDFR